MSMTLSELRQAVIDNTNRGDKSDLIDRNINLGLREAVQRHKFKEMKQEFEASIVEDDLELSLPEGCDNLVEVRLGQEDTTSVYPLDVLSKSRFVKLYPNLTSTVSARPCAGFVEGGRLRFLPASNAAYTVYLTAYSRPSTLESDDDTNPIQALDNYLISYATAKLLKSIEKFQEANQWMADAEKEFILATRDDKQQPAVNQAGQDFPQKEAYPVNQPWEDPFNMGR